jgi:hypothetical protein
LNKIATLAAVCSTAAAVVLACSSSTTAPPFQSGDDASMTGSGGDAAGTGDDASMEASGPVVPCDAAIVLPTGTATGGACGDCLMKNCMPALTTCQNDCVCVSSVECLAVNVDNYTLCPEALSAIGAGNEGLKAIAACIPPMCPVCNEQPD